MKRNEKVSTEEMMLYERDDDQNLPVHLAVENQHIDIVNYLVNLASDKGSLLVVCCFKRTNYDRYIKNFVLFLLRIYNKILCVSSKFFQVNFKTISYNKYLKAFFYETSQNQLVITKLCTVKTPESNFSANLRKQPPNFNQVSPGT